MSEMDKKQNGIEPINDNELEAVAGGAADKNTPQQAETPRTGGSSRSNQKIAPQPIKYAVVISNINGREATRF